MWQLQLSLLILGGWKLSQLYHIDGTHVSHVDIKACLRYHCTVAAEVAKCLLRAADSDGRGKRNVARKPNASIILNTHNRAERLRLCLPAYLGQTATDFEMVVADDASDDDTEEVVREFAAAAPFPVLYVRHDLEGHRRAAILNRGVAAARSDFLIFTDADALPLRDLVEVHCAARAEKRLLIGGRVRLDEDETRRVTPEMVRSHGYESFLTVRRRRELQSTHRLNLFYTAIRKRRRPHNRALNMAIERWAMFAVNGFDENCQGWGDLDGELRERLKRIGVRPKCVCNRAVVFHLWHPPHSSRKTRPNRDYVRRPNIPIWCENGIFELPDG